jgi:signal transduction histidine kinase
MMIMSHNPNTSLPASIAAPLRAIFSRLATIWRAFTLPNPPIADEEETSRYRLLAGTHIVMFTGIIVLVGSSILSNPIEEWLYDADTLAAFVGVAITSGLYLWLRRTQRISTAAALTIAVVLVVTTMPPFFPGSRSTTLYYAVFVPLLTGMFFPGRSLLMWAAAFPVLLNLIPPVLSALGVEVAIGRRFTSSVVEFLVFMSVLLVVFINHLQTLTRIRSNQLQIANDALRQNEALLEQRVIERTRELDEARQLTEVFYRMSAAMNHADSYTSVLQIVSDEVSNPALIMALMLYDLPPGEHAQAMGRLIASKLPGEAIQAHDMPLPIGVVPGPTDPMLLIPDMTDSPYAEARSHYLAMGVMAVASAAIVIDNRVVGSLSYTSMQPVQFATHDLEVLRIGAQLAAAAIERRQRLDQQVAIAERLRAVDAMKSQFLASMSHELRTPLNAILNFTEFVSIGMMGEVNPRQRDALNKALESGRHLLSLINDVLDITKIESGMMQLFVERDIDLYAELNAVKAAALSLIHDKALRYIEDIDPDLPLLVGDRRRIRQILLNLVSNAIKFTEAGTVTVSVKRRGDELLFGVIDTGPGIAPEDTSLIFEPFVQMPDGIRHAGGTGLGLPISNRLVQAHGGRLWLESTPGHGAAFFFTLPIAARELIEKMPV